MLIRRSGRNDNCDAEACFLLQHHHGLICSVPLVFDAVTGSAVLQVRPALLTGSLGYAAGTVIGVGVAQLLQQLM